MTHIILTPRGSNIGQNIINYLTANQLYGKVEIITLHTVRDVQHKIAITEVAVIPKPKFKP